MKRLVTALKGLRINRAAGSRIKWLEEVLNGLRQLALAQLEMTSRSCNDLDDMNLLETALSGLKGN